MQPSKEDPIPASPLAPLIVQLLYDFKPAIGFEHLTRKVEEYCGRIDAQMRPAPNADHAHYFMLDAQAEYKGGRAPSQLCLCHAQMPLDSERLETSLQQTWDWDEARQVVASTQWALVANDLLAGGLPPKVRNKQFRGFIRAVQEIAPCQAMHWLNTQQMINPARFLFQQDQEGTKPLYGSINVRFFNIQNSNGDFLMDTLGLAVLGLPDIQCHFRKLPPNSIAQMLGDVACYIFDNGDVIKDGETVPGIKENERWKCQHEMALVKPERPVLDIDPGVEFAAGQRGRP
jgi:hypothetical protein